MNAAQNEIETDRQPSTSSNRIRIALSVASFAALVFLAAKYEFPKWKLASAFEQFETGNAGQALDSISSISNTNPHDQLARTTEIRWLAMSGQGDLALEKCAQLLEEQPDWREAIEVLKIDVLMSQQKYKEALALFKKTKTEDFVSRTLEISELNQFAYFRALANTQIASANSEINDVSHAYGGYWSNAYGLNLNLQHITLIAASLLATETTENEKAIEQLTLALERLDRPLIDSIFVMFVQPSDVPSVTDAQAALLTIRSMKYDQIGKTCCSAMDRISVSDLGFNADQLLRKFPEDVHLVRQLGDAVAYLDTRGFVRYRLRQYDLALDDMNIAVFGAEVFLRQVNAYPNLVELQMVENSTAGQREKNAKHTLAVLLYHRMLVQDAIGLEDGVTRDREYRSRLGFDDKMAIH